MCFDERYSWSYMSSSRLSSDHAEHPLVVDVAKKAELFDDCVTKFEVPSLPIVVYN
jgi:hypothetical protein